MGYEGHLYSQGLDYEPARRDLARLMDGDDGWRDAARRLGVRYLFWGPREAREWPESSKPWRKCAPTVASSPHGELFLLTPCLLED